LEFSGERWNVGKRGGFGTTLVLALVIVVLSIALGVGLTRFGQQLPVLGPLFEEEPAQTTTGTVVVEGIQDLNQLTTLRWRGFVFIDKESGGTKLEQLFSGEVVRLVAVGDVEAGVDFAELGQHDVQVNEQKVTIRLPEPEILSVSLDEDETRVYDRDFGLLNIRPDDELAEEARDVAVDRLEEAARDDDVLERAQRNAEDNIRAFVISLGFEEVEFVD
jgi:hypothetical protein